VAAGESDGAGLRYRRLDPPARLLLAACRRSSHYGPGEPLGFGGSSGQFRLDQVGPFSTSVAMRQPAPGDPGATPVMAPAGLLFPIHAP